MLRKFLPSVVRHSADEDVVVYVVDNGSTDQSVAWVKSEYPSVGLMEFGENLGFADGYNSALCRLIGTKYFVLLNSDVEVTAGWLRPMVDYMDQHPEVAACQPKIKSWHHRDRFEHAGACGGFIDKYGYPFCRGRIMSVVEKDHGQYDGVVPVFWATGAALFIRKKDFDRAGGLDGSFFAHMEEIDLCWRLRTLDRKIVCIPQSTVYHVGAATLKRENPRKTFLNFRNNLLMLYKNLPQDELKPVMRMRLFLDWVAAFSFLMKGQASNFRAVLKARREFKAIRHKYLELRELNLGRTMTDSIPERYNGSIVYQYYIKGRKYFSQLIFNKNN